MPVLTKINSNAIADDAVTTAKVADDAVTTAKVADDAIWSMNTDWGGQNESGGTYIYAAFA